MQPKLRGALLSRSGVPAPSTTSVAASPRAFFLQNDVSDVFICNNTINSFTSAVVQNESSCGGRSCPVTPLSNRRLTVRGNLFTNNPAIAFLGSGDSQAVEYNSFDR